VKDYVVETNKRRHRVTSVVVREKVLVETLDGTVVRHGQPVLRYYPPVSRYHPADLVVYGDPSDVISYLSTRSRHSRRYEILKLLIEKI